jgi:hypothetical protein
MRGSFGVLIAAGSATKVMTQQVCLGELLALLDPSLLPIESQAIGLEDLESKKTVV